MVLASVQVSKLKQDVEAERASRAKLREEVEGERERVKKAITELKRKTDRWLASSAVTLNPRDAKLQNITECLIPNQQLPWWLGI